MDFRFNPVSLADIADNDRRFSVSTDVEKTNLGPSIRAVGLLQPPVLIAADHGYAIVSGFRRIQTLRTLGWENVLARVLPPGTPILDCARMAIADNCLQRVLNVVEQSRAYALLRKYSVSTDDWQAFAESVGLPASETAMNRIIPVAEFPEALQHALLEGSIALPVALQIHQIENSAEREAWVSFFRTINTNLNLQRELFELIHEIAKRDDLSCKQLINQSAVDETLQAPKLSIPQKVQHLRQLFRTIRYPELSRAEDRYHEALKSLKLNPRLQLHPPREFEGKSFRLTLVVESRRQLEALQPEIDKIKTAANLLPE